MASILQPQFQPGELKLEMGDGVKDDYKALAKKDDIKDIARLLLATGDSLNKMPIVEERREERKPKLTSKRPSRLSHFVDLVDAILEWLEHAGKDTMQNLTKQEVVLRGIYHITGLASEVNLFEILDFVRSFLDVPEDPFPGQQEYVVRCLKDVEEQRQRICQSVDLASGILREIIDGDEVDFVKAKQFDNIVREAHVQINSCRRRLAGAEETILELSAKMKTVKWFSRAFRVTGWGVSCCFFYQKYQESSINLPVLFAGSALAGAAWLSLFPSRAYKYYESFEKLVAEHRLLIEKFDNLQVSLSNAKEHIDGL